MTPSSVIPVLDRAEGKRRAGGDEKLCNELVAVFLSDLPRLTQLIQAAIAQQSAKALRLAAHSLRGSASQIGALAVVERASILERMAKAGDLSNAQQQEHLLAEDLRQLSLALQATADPPAPLPS